MKKSKIYTYKGKGYFEMEGKGAMLLNFHILDCFTKYVISKGADETIGLYIKEGYVKYKSLFSNKWEQKSISNEIIYFPGHVINFDDMICEVKELDIPFDSWETNFHTVELDENNKILKVELHKKALISIFEIGFNDALVNKPMRKFSGIKMSIYAKGYNTCNRTNGEEVDCVKILDI